MGKYVALLRGINVGGNNTISMAELRACCEMGGLANVRTYINSGNVLFESPETDIGTLVAKLETLLRKTFSHYEARLLILSHQQLQAIVRRAPKSFGSQPDTYHYDVIFLMPPLTAAEAIRSVRVKTGVDTAAAGQGVLYFSRLSARRTQSRLREIMASPNYQNMTIRNWNTTTKLLALLQT